MEPVFKVPSLIPQDLALILDFVDPPPPELPHDNIDEKTAPAEEDISSSGSESDEDVAEVEAEIATGLANEAPASGCASRSLEFSILVK